MKGRAGKQSKSISFLNIKVESKGPKSRLLSILRARVHEALYYSSTTLKRKNLPATRWYADYAVDSTAACALHWLHGHKRKGYGDQGERRLDSCAL